jgi:hypothetical protein
MNAGFGIADITPHPPVFLAGFGDRREPANDVHDPLHARALYMQDDRAALCLVVCDLLAMSADVAARVRDAVGAATGLPREHVLTSCVHTHSGPSTLTGSEALGWIVPDGYIDRVAARCASAAVRAREGASPVTLRFASGPQPHGLAYNRRGYPFDPRIGGLEFRGPDGSRTGVLAGVAIHPVALGPQWLEVSSDWVGPCRQWLERRGGTAIVLQGAQGDVNPGAGEGWLPYDETAALGGRIAAAVEDALVAARTTDGPLRVARAETIEVPIGATPLTQLIGLPDRTAVELVEWDICGVRLVTVPGEAFQSFGREVERARGGDVILAGLAPAWHGYLPHPYADGYEETVSYGPDAVRTILDALTRA